MRKTVPWLGAIIIIIIFFGATGVMVKTAQRMAANNPQYQIAEDTAAQLTQPQSTRFSMVNLSAHVDMSDSLAPFVVIYDIQGNPLTGTGYLNGKLPTIPPGVLRHASPSSPNAVTWQPQSDVREAAVVARSPSGEYVLAARSLKEVEREEHITYVLTFIGISAALAVLALAYIVSIPRR